MGCLDQCKDALRELGDKEEYNDANKHRRRVAALACLGLGLILDSGPTAVLRPRTS